MLAGLPARAGFFLAMVIFAFGETLFSPTIPAIVNDLAPERLRGRYNDERYLPAEANVVKPELAEA